MISFKKISDNKYVIQVESKHPKVPGNVSIGAVYKSNIDKIWKFESYENEMWTVNDLRTVVNFMDDLVK